MLSRTRFLCEGADGQVWIPTAFASHLSQGTSGSSAVPGLSAPGKLGIQTADLGLKACLYPEYVHSVHLQSYRAWIQPPIIPPPKLQTQLEKRNDKVGSPAGLGPVSLQTFLQFHCETSPLRLRDGAENRSYLLAPRCHRRRSEQSKSGETRRCSSCGCFSPL